MYYMRAPATTSVLLETRPASQVRPNNGGPEREFEIKLITRLVYTVFPMEERIVSAHNTRSYRPARALLVFTPVSVFCG